jgi:disulfide bond formation protein DsbB
MQLEQINFLLGLGTLCLQIATVFLFAVFFLKQSELSVRVSGLLEKWGIPLAFFLTFVSVVLSLYYSEILGIVPCSLCWFQRICIYSLAIILGIAWWKKDTGITLYAMVLSALGMAFALYHHVIQTIGSHGALPCPAGGGDCGQRFMFEMGYITYPLMAFSLLAFVFIVMLFVRRAAAK